MELRERLAPYIEDAGDADQGWTVVLIDNSSPEDGDFVYVETFDSEADLYRAAKPPVSGLSARLVEAARNVIRGRRS